MKTGILTFHRAYNYGSALQAYALNRVLNDEAGTAETIDFRNVCQDELYTIFNHGKSPKDLVRNFLSLIKYRQLKQKKKSFDDFINNEIKLSGLTTYDRRELEELNDQYDYFVCGSDQIWNVFCSDFSEVYLLDFVNDKSKCISYAASIGIGEIPEENKKMFSELLKGYKAISVREKRGAELIKPLVNQNVSVMPDPVVLLGREQWSELAEDAVIKGKYILGYYIGDVPGMRDFAVKLHKKTGCKVVVINKNIRDLLYYNKKYYSAGPKEFISLIKNAEYVCTDSFHAVMFSIIFHKNFWVFIDGKKQNSGTRIINILEKAGLTDRAVNGSSENLLIDKEIDYSGIDEIIKDMREQALNYLNQNICR